MDWSILSIPAHGPLFEGAIAVYGEAFSRPPYSDPDRGREIRQRMRETHALRPGFQLLVACTGPERVVGMAYGYRGTAGQWWHDTVTRALKPLEAAEWLGDSYELVEIAVHPAVQGHGIGAGLIRELLADRPAATCVLSTRTDSDAHNLYRRLGFETIIEMPFTNGGYPFYVMGKKLLQMPGRASEGTMMRDG
ncbi:MAG: GNAT family N-acetyltransferase [Dehalococcoidia bacterium]|jgi:ribosomal protein S18 acetylase RimI-like enzyme|uniref:GNAT family N-acetyltransferase n=1 Tax=Candidatus Amarobacter glycogenicus TaxID=3140699 RepID=UPI002A0EA946|nr:GNAT family N-acetyltransferase [Dehalococcoidia bacterium]MBK6561693.1 GNAT family N-acetyltransferase [Dehalococcoidia bacterium]MBK7127023.1 GNAT family N-acetyltransferase [Dehalococcoidia bacterium]MBK9343929.1 GNAT family N-acetyltransferase [Dehalococcoidia bacterium]MBK9547325.1 GNAT family N-acetyltransferase [Dehalococcoidia bacterium]